MQTRTRSPLKSVILAVVLAAISSVALSQANPQPKQIHVVGPLPWRLDAVQCEEFGPDPILVESFIEELWGTELGPFNQGFRDGSGGLHLVQPAHWTMSAISLNGDYSWWGRVAGHATSSSPAQTNGGNLGFVVNAILGADGDWPDLRLQLTLRFVIDANGELRIFEDMLELNCVH